MLPPPVTAKVIVVRMFVLAQDHQVLWWHVTVQNVRSVAKWFSLPHENKRRINKKEV